MQKYVILGICFFLLLGSLGAADEYGKTFETVRIKTQKTSSTSLRNISDILESQISQRCEAEVVKEGVAALTVELAVAKGTGMESYRIEDRQGGGVRIVGNDERGLLFGVGKFLHTARYDLGGFTPGKWRGESLPIGTFRAVYLATHFMNYYESAPIDELKQYVEELGLWGYNTILVSYPTWQFDNLNCPDSRKWLDRFKIIFVHAKQCGLRVGLIEAPNQGFKTAPEAARAISFPTPFHRKGWHGINLCPSKPEGHKLLMQICNGLVKEFKNIDLDYFVFWPYDEGGCGCEQCWPWGARGYLNISRDWTEQIQSEFPTCKTVLSTWCYENENDKNPDGEWTGLEKSLKKDKSWIDYIMADGHEDYFPKYLMEEGIPGGIPLLNFPEISMFGMGPWGGYGANPAPDHFQKLWDRIKHMAVGGAPYSEGIYEDLNKAIIAGFYWDPDRKAECSVREYVSFEFSPDVAEDMLEVVRIFEQNHYRDQIEESSFRAFDLVTKAENSLPEKVRKSWRWRIFYLRALIDKEMFERKGKLEGKTLKAAFDELTKIYHAENAHSMPIKPPQLK